MIFDVIAFIVFGILFVAIVVAIVFLGSLPGKIARRRGHAQADAVTAAGWIGIASFGILWPIAFVWAFVRPVQHGDDSASGNGELADLADVRDRLEALESAVDKLQAK